MVQRKVANKIGIKSHLHKLDTQLVNLKPSPSSPSCSSQTHEKLKKIMKKSRSIKRPDESRLSPPFKNMKTPPSTPQKQSPNYMKSTSSFEARKEQYSPSPKTPSPKGSKGSKSNEPSSSNKGSRISSLKMVRTLTKTPSFKPIRSSKKVILCEDMDSQRATCSSTLKDSKFPNYLQLNDGGNELDGTSAMKVCPYSYCSLNGHHHAPVPPLKCFLSARRRALKTQKGFKLGCLSPRQIKPILKKSAIKEPVVLAQEQVDNENKDFFIDIYHKEPPIEDIRGKDACIKFESVVNESAINEPVILAQEEVDMEEKDFLDNIFSDDTRHTLVELQGKDVYIRPELVEPRACESFVHQVNSDDMENKGGQDFECSDIDWEEGYCSNSDQMENTSVERLYKEHQESYNEHQELYNEHLALYDEESVSSGAWSDEDGDCASDSSCQPTKINQDNMNHDPVLKVSSSAYESDITNKTDDLQNLNHPIKDQNINNEQESKTVPESAEKPSNETNKNHNTIIYNIINFNISVFIINGKKTATVQVPAASVAADNMGTEEPMKEPSTSNEDNIASEINQIIEEEQIPIKVEDIASTELLINETENHDNPEQECNYSNFIDAVTKMNEEPVLASDPDEIISETDISLRNRKKLCQETDGEQPEFNPRGPNFLPETADPDAEKVDLKHQTIDERKNAEEWMVDFALQQAVTTLAPARKKKVALLVEAFEKVMPDSIPRYETQNHVSKAFTNSRPMQACS